MVKKLIFLILFSLSLFAFDKSVSNGQIMGTAKCPICNMDIRQYYKTSYAVVYKDGSKKHFCSMSCLKKVLGSKNIKTIYVADAKKGKMIEAKSAIYVIGSKIPATMGAKKSKFAFSSKVDAVAFQKKYGGIIGNFAQAKNSN